VDKAGPNRFNQAGNEPSQDVINIEQCTNDERTFV